MKYLDEYRDDRIAKKITDEIRRNMPRDAPPLEGPGIVAMALQEQLGLKVDSSKASVPVVVIDRMEKTPVEN